MSRSEEPYFRKIFTHFSKLKGIDVLEVGFGLGISATLIQNLMQPKTHDIYEIDKSIYQDLEDFAQSHPSVLPHLGIWKKHQITKKYDFIFFDPFDYTEADEFSYQKWLNERSQMASRMKKILSSTGILCHPHFGDGDVPHLPGFETLIIERLKVPSIKMEDGSRCEDAAIIYHKPI